MNNFKTSDNIYLLNHSVGKMPVSTRECLERSVLGPWETGTPDPWGQWMEIFDDFRQALASLFSSSMSAFCPQQNLTSGLSKIISGFPPATDKNVILMSANDFPSMGFALHQAAKLGYKVKMIPAIEDVQSTNTWQAHFSEQVYCVFITHVHYNTSKLVPVAKICELAKLYDVLSIVDIAQSSGIVPIDLSLWSADFVLGSCVKWLCGGPGAGFLWQNPASVFEIEPKDVGWFSHSNPFEFDISHFCYANDALKFWGGTPSVFPYAVAANSIKQIKRIGVDDIRSHNHALVSQLISAVSSTKLVSPVDKDLRGGTLVIKFNNEDKVAAALKAQNVQFDVRPLGMRFSPHIYNTKQQMAVVAQCFNADDSA